MTYEQLAKCLLKAGPVGVLYQRRYIYLNDPERLTNYFIQVGNQDFDPLNPAPPETYISKKRETK